MFYFYQIVLWLIFLLFISSKIQNKKIRITFSAIASFVSTLEISAIYLTSKFIDYRFYYHMNLNAIEGHAFQFVLQFFIFSGLFFLMVFLFYRVSKKMTGHLLSHNKIFIPVTLILFTLLSLPNGIINEAYKIYQIVNAQEKNFIQALKDVGIKPKEYITPSQLTASKGKNIIVISIESLEQGFLGKQFDNITPNLTSLTKDWTYFNQMPVGPGGGWTAGSLYKHQVGMPAFFQGQVNTFFKGTRNVKLTGLGHILNKAGYASKYIVGNAEFAGMSDILTAYGIPVISENNSIGKYPKAAWGLNDYDIFQEAKLQVTELKKSSKPFAIFLSTINTHFPAGIYDKRMEKFIAKNKDTLEFSATAVDYLIGDFIQYLKEHNLYENTAIYIFPDHTLMGSGGSVHNKLAKEKRQLYLLTNIKEDSLPKKTKDTLYQIDLPKMIISGANIKTNAKFLVDFIQDENVIDFLRNNSVKLTTLNTASVTRDNYKDGIKIQVNDDKLIVTSAQNIETQIFQANKVYDFTFNPEMVLIKKEEVPKEQAYNLNTNDKQYKLIHLIVEVNSDKIVSAYIGNKYFAGFSKNGYSTISFSKEEIKLLTNSNKKTLIKNKKTLIKNKKVHKKIIHIDPLVVSITSSEYITSKNIGSEIKVGNTFYSVQRGLNLLTIDYQGKAKVENFDIYASKDQANSFLAEIKKLVLNKKFWAIASHDAIKTDYPGFKEKLKVLGLKLLPTLNGRIAYIAYSTSNNTIKEFSSKTTISYLVSGFIKPLTKEELRLIKKQKAQNNIEIKNYAKDKNRFIAHAGGVIDGHKYTNSLDALNLSYKKGFRLFELDIIKTYDNIYVASHDWKHWAEITKYKGQIPPDNNTFKQYKIYNKYMPMNIDDINIWFKQHKDAILVTDKVNTPVDFSSHFIDKKRLMMELFTWDAVKKGIKAGIRSSMPTGGIIGGNKIEYMKKLGITDIATSRRMINSQKAYLKKIVNSGINIYAFHLHFDKGMDEKHVICNERNYFYGMYADNWNFNTCQVSQCCTHDDSYKDTKIP